MPFVKKAEAISKLVELLDSTRSREVVDFLISSSLLPQFISNTQKLVRLEDIWTLSQVIAYLSTDDILTNEDRNLFYKGKPTHLRIGLTTTIELNESDFRRPPEFAAAVRNLMNFVGQSDIVKDKQSEQMSYIGALSLETSSLLVDEYAKRQIERLARCSSIRSSQFANTAYYMGSKRNLSAFLVEALIEYTTSSSIILDLMCGSGASAAAFSRNWQTVASDAQSFCRLLAEVQGGGYSVERAEKALDKILPLARQHSQQMRKWVDEFIGWEDQVFHSDIAGTALDEYRRLIDSYPTYPDGQRHGNWDPLLEVSRRKSSPKKKPFCLFTAYFANIFFGIRQCVEIDSLRFAISQLDLEEDRRWALGALVSAVSVVGTTYGGHFAQPIIRSSASVTPNNIGRIVERRAMSVLHEFSIRLISLAQESERSFYPILTVPGPWKDALDTFKQKFDNMDVVVYLDAPYKREEYSRYYHVLETLVLYNYPTSIGVGRMPDKSAGERFQSEFFRRNKSDVENAFIDVITNVLACADTCAWSYSDNGDADIVSVCDQIEKRTANKISSYAIPYEHKALGSQSSKAVKEYLIIFHK